MEGIFFVFMGASDVGISRSWGPGYGLVHGNSEAASGRLVHQTGRCPLCMVMYIRVKVCCGGYPRSLIVYQN